MVSDDALRIEKDVLLDDLQGMPESGISDEEKLKFSCPTISSELVDSPAASGVFKADSQMLLDAQYLTSPDGNSGQSFEMLPPSPCFENTRLLI